MADLTTPDVGGTVDVRHEGSRWRASRSHGFDRAPDLGFGPTLIDALAALADAVVGRLQ